MLAVLADLGDLLGKFPPEGDLVAVSMAHDGQGDAEAAGAQNGNFGHDGFLSMDGSGLFLLAQLVFCAV